MSRVLRRIGLLVALASFALVAHAAFVVPYDVRSREIVVELPRLPDGWVGREIAVLSDLQVGMWAANLGAVEEAVALVVRRDPAAVLVAGDLLYSDDPPPAEQTQTVLRLLRPLLEAGLPVVVVLGNHDIAVGAAGTLTRALQDAGVQVLRNEAVMLRSGGDPLWVVGLGPRRFGLDRPREALADVPAGVARLWLMHNPASFPQLPPGVAPIAFAGHTHCGQIVLPVGDGWSRLELRVPERYVIEGFSGPAYGASGNRLFVTCGLGFSRLPLRLGAEPEVVFATLDRPDR